MTKQHADSSRAGEAWCPTCGATTPDGEDCDNCAQWWADNPPPDGCTCGEVVGEDPDCIHHGRETPWGKENPDVAD